MPVNPWRTFARNHPKAAKWVWQIGVFYLFSLAVTVLQYALFTFLPYLFGEGLASTAFMCRIFRYRSQASTTRGMCLAMRWRAMRPEKW